MADEPLWQVKWTDINGEGWQWVDNLTEEQAGALVKYCQSLQVRAKFVQVTRMDAVSKDA